MYTVPVDLRSSMAASDSRAQYCCYQSHSVPAVDIGWWLHQHTEGISLQYKTTPIALRSTCAAQYRTLSYHCDMTLSQEFQPMGAQLSLKAVLPLAGFLATASDRSSKTGPRDILRIHFCHFQGSISGTTFAIRTTMLRLLVPGQAVIFFNHAASPIWSSQQIRWLLPCGHLRDEMGLAVTKMYNLYRISVIWNRMT